MSLANSLLKPIPVSKESGKYAKVDKLYLGLNRIYREFEVVGGAANFADNLEEFVFDEYGTLDGETTCPKTKIVDERLVFTNCYLEEQDISKRQRDGASTVVTKIYQEAYDTVREVAKPITTTDDNNRSSTRRKYVILNTAPEGNKSPSVGELFDPDNPDQVLIGQVSEKGNAVTTLQRDYLQATSEMEEVGGCAVEVMQNGLTKATCQSIGLISADDGEKDVGNVTKFIDGKRLTLAGFNKEQNAVAKTITRVWIEAGILSVSSSRVGGVQQVEVSAIGMDEGDVSSALSEVGASHILVSTGIRDYKGFEAASFTYQVEDFKIRSRTENGLLRVEQTELSESNFDDRQIGVERDGTLYLSGEEIDNGNTIKKRVSRWAEAGILSAQKEFGSDGLLYVTFVSQGTKNVPTTLNGSITGIESEVFQGGSPASIRYSKVRDVSGFRKYTVTSFMKADGTALSSSGDNLLNEYDKWISYIKPGEIVLDISSGVKSTPSVDRSLRVKVYEYLSTDGTFPNDDFKPYSVNAWAYYSISYVVDSEEVVAPVVISKAAKGYLSDSILVGGNTTFIGTPVKSLSGSSASDPYPSVFYALNDQVVKSSNEVGFVTDEGVTWYRKVKVVVDGTFGEYLIDRYE